MLRTCHTQNYVHAVTTNWCQALYVFVVSIYLLLRNKETLLLAKYLVVAQIFCVVLLILGQQLLLFIIAGALMLSM